MGAKVVIVPTVIVIEPRNHCHIRGWRLRTGMAFLRSNGFAALDPPLDFLLLGHVPRVRPSPALLGGVALRFHCGQPTALSTDGRDAGEARGLQLRLERGQ